MNTKHIPTSGNSRGAVWLAALTGDAGLRPGYPPSVLVADGTLAGSRAVYITVVPDPDNSFPRARNGEVGLIEGWQLARAVQETVAADLGKTDKTVIVAVVDASSQAYGRREEAYGIHQALAGAAGAYAEARLKGHPVIALLVGKAMSGAFLAHGYQANRMLAIQDPEVMVHAMGKKSAARITLRSVAELETLSAAIPPMAYDIESYATLGLLWRLLRLEKPNQPSQADVDAVVNNLEEALQDILQDPVRDLRSRQGAANRNASLKVREMMRARW